MEEGRYLPGGRVAVGGETSRRPRSAEKAPIPIRGNEIIQRIDPVYQSVGDILDVADSVVPVEQLVGGGSESDIPTGHTCM